MDRAKRTIEILRRMLTRNDIEELQGDDYTVFRITTSIAEAEKPLEIERVVVNLFSNYEVEFDGLEVALNDVVRVVFVLLISILETIRLNILQTYVKSRVLTGKPTRATAVTMPGTLTLSCPDCGNELEEIQKYCTSCGWISDSFMYP